MYKHSKKVVSFLIAFSVIALSGCGRSSSPTPLTFPNNLGGTGNPNIPGNCVPLNQSNGQVAYYIPPAAINGDSARVVSTQAWPVTGVALPTSIPNGYGVYRFASTGAASGAVSFSIWTGAYNQSGMPYLPGNSNPLYTPQGYGYEGQGYIQIDPYFVEGICNSTGGCANPQFGSTGGLCVSHVALDLGYYANNQWGTSLGVYNGIVRLYFNGNASLYYDLNF